MGEEFSLKGGLDKGVQEAEGHEGGSIWSSNFSILKKEPNYAAISKIHKDWLGNKKLGAKILSPAFKVTFSLASLRLHIHRQLKSNFELDLFYKYQEIF